MANETISVLNELIETSKDGEKGFSLAAQDTKEPELTSVFNEAARSCRVAARELQEQVRALGGKAEEGGSAKGAVHRGWLSVKATASGRDSGAILEECERGEDYAKARYEEALKHDLPGSVMSMVQRQYEGLIENHDRVRELRNRYRSHVT